MAVIYLTSVSGSPGVTTTALALTMNWPRPVVLVEADISKPSGILPGYLRGQMDHSRGLTPLAVQHQRGQLRPRSIWEQSILLGEDRFFVPGFSSIAAGAGAGASFWNALGATLSAIATQGADVLVDAGRFGVRDDRKALMQLADMVTLVTRPVMPDIAAVRARRQELSELLNAVGHDDWLTLLLVDAEHEAFRDGEVSRAVELPVLHRLTSDPRVAAVYSVGAEATINNRRSLLTRDLALLPDVLDQAIRERRDRLGAIPLEEVTA